MKLSDKFENTLLEFPYIDSEDGQCLGSGFMTHYSSLKCAEIAEQFVIGFFVWINNSYWIQYSNDLWYFKSDGNPEEEITIKQLYEIYKKTL